MEHLSIESLAAPRGIVLEIKSFAYPNFFANILCFVTSDILNVIRGRETWDVFFSISVSWGKNMPCISDIICAYSCKSLFPETAER